MKIKISSMVSFITFLVCVLVLNNGTVFMKVMKLLFVGVSVCIIIKRGHINWNRYLTWLLLFALFCNLSFFWAQSKEYAVSGMMTVSLNSLCLLCMSQFLDDKNSSVYTLYKCVAVAPIIKFVVLICNYGFSVFQGLRSIGADHNGTGMIAGLGVTFSLVLWTKRRRSNKYMILSIINMFIVILTMSRKALLYLAFPLLIYYVLSGKQPIKRLAKIISVPILISIGYLMIMKIPFLYNKVGAGIEMMLSFFMNGYGDASAAGRNTRIVQGLRWFNKKPILGYGILNYNYMFKRFDPLMDMVIADNNYIDIAVNLGIVGLLIYFSLHVYTLVKSIKNVHKNNELCFLCSILITLLICDYGSSSYIYLHSQFYLMFVVVRILTILNCSADKRILLRKNCNE